PLRPNQKTAAPVEQRLQHAFGSRIGHFCTRVWACDSARSRVRAAEVAHGSCAGDNDRVTNAAVRYYRRLVLQNHRSDYARHLVLFDSAGVPTDYVARGVRCLPTRQSHPAGNGDHTARRRSSRCKQSAERRRAYLYRGIHCCAGQFALVDVDPRPALIDRSTKKWISPSLYLLAELPICYRRGCRRGLSLRARRWISYEATQTRNW